MSYANQNDLGLAGLALLRKRLIGKSSEIKTVIDEISGLLNDPKNPLITKEDAKKYNVVSGYRAWASTYDSIPNLLIEIEEPAVKTIIKDFSQGKALDAGCGTGRYSKLLNSLGFDVTGVDISSEMLHKAKVKNKHANFIKGTLTKLPFDNSSFDLVICALALTHFKNFDKAIFELSRVVRYGGNIVISDIHPLLVTLGGQADFNDKFGKWVYVRNYIHWYANYLNAFNLAGLKVIKCLEPEMVMSQVKLAHSGSQLSLDTIVKALLGLPIAIVWVLEKS